MKRYYFEVTNAVDGSQLVTIYIELLDFGFVSAFGPYNMADEDEAFGLVSRAAELEAAGYTYVKRADVYRSA